MASGMPSRRRQIRTTGVRVDLCGVEIRPRQPGPVEEQSRRFMLDEQLGCRRRLVGGDVEWRDLPHPLALHAEGLSARRQRFVHVRARRRQPRRQFGGAADDVLAVVQQE